MKKTKNNYLKNYTHNEVPATVGLVKEVRNELLSGFHSLEHQMKGTNKRIDSMDKRFVSVDKRFVSVDKRFDSVDKRFDSVDKRIDSLENKMESRFAQMESRFAQIDARFESHESKFDQLIALAHGTKVLMEEQRSENRIVLDGLKTVNDRLDRMDQRFV